MSTQTSVKSIQTSNVPLKLKPIDSRIPPQSNLDEVGVLSCMMLSRDGYEQSVQALDINHFYRHDHQIIYDAIVTVWQSLHGDETLELPFLRDVLEKSDHLEDVGGSDYLVEIAESGIQPNVGRYIENVKKNHKRRQAILLFSRAENDSYLRDIPIDETIRSVQFNIAEIIGTPPKPEKNTEYQPFPVDALPDPARSFVSESAAAIGCDPAYIVLPMLAAVSGVIGNSRTIYLKRTWSEPAIVWAAIIGESGSMKSPALYAPMNHIHRRQREALKRYAREIKECESDKTLQEPVCRRYIVEDTTVEALSDRLEANPHGLLLTRDELAGWLGSFNQYKKSGGGDVGHWLSMFHGRGLLVDRKNGKQTINIPRAAVSITGSIQPGILARSFTQEHRDNGLLARFLLAMPPKRLKVWSEDELSQVTEDAYNDMIDRLLRLSPNIALDGQESPVSVYLRPDAKEALITYINAHNADGEALEGEQAASWSKLEGYMPRLTLLCHLIRESSGEVKEGGMIDVTSVCMAQAMIEWLKSESMRIYNVFDAESKKEHCQVLMEKIQNRGGRVTPRDWKNSRNKKTVDEAKRELQLLVDAGYGKFETVKAGGRGRDSIVFVCFCMPNS